MSLVKLTVSQSDGYIALCEYSLFQKICIESRNLEWERFNSDINLCPRSETLELSSMRENNSTNSHIIRLLIKIPKSDKSQLTCPSLWQVRITMDLVQMQKFPVGSCNHRWMQPSKPAASEWSDRNLLVASKSSFPCTFLRRFEITFPFSPSALPCCLSLSHTSLWH